jgi:hypothetical protein
MEKHVQNSPDFEKNRISNSHILKITSTGQPRI